MFYTIRQWLTPSKISEMVKKQRGRKGQMADIKKTADGVDNDSPYRALEADAAQMKIEEAQGELEPGEAMTECEMEVEADMLLQAALEEKLKAEARLEAALEEKRAAEAKLQAALDEKREAEARLEGAAVIRPEAAASEPEHGAPELAASEPEFAGTYRESAELEQEAAGSDEADEPERKMAGQERELHETEPEIDKLEPVGENSAANGSDSGETYREERAGRGRSRARRSRKKNAGQGIEMPEGVHDSQNNHEKTAFPAGQTEAAAALQEGRGNKNQKGKKAAIIAACVLAAVIVAGGGAYAAMAQKYKKVFFPNTIINGMNASGRTVAEVKEMIAGGIENYVLTIEEREGGQEQLTGEDIKLKAKFDGTLEQIVTTQNPYAWLSYQLNPAEYTIGTMIEYDEEAFTDAVKGLKCMDTALMKEPVNAGISDYVPGQGYHIVPETAGTYVSEDVLRSSITDAVMNLKDTLSLEEAGAYKQPEITQDDAALKERLDTMNRYVSTTVTYKFGDKSEVLNGDRTHEWLVTDESGGVSIDTARAAGYVEELAAAYNTSNKAKNFKTSYGQTIQVKGGTYGWKINQKEETAELIAILKSGQSQEREPVYSQKAASHGENDYGDTYVEINLTAQHLFFYKNGSLVVESDFVSGNLSKGWGTPAGTYPLTYKQRNAVLKGEGYRTPVDYWMPFNGGIGMHDATWRSSFGGTIYKTGGSHGCINLPHSVAKKIYENIQAGMPVICYNLAGTEKGTSATPPPAQVPAEVPTQAPAEVPTQAPAEVPTQAPAEIPTQAPAVPETQAPAPPETTAPAGPGSDTGHGGGASGPGSEIR